jgi:hypothetical protein
MKNRKQNPENVNCDINELDLRLILNAVRQEHWNVSNKEFMTAILYSNILVLNELTDIKELLKKREKKEQ